MVGVAGAAALCWTAWLLLFRRDPRRVRAGVALLLAAHLTAALAVLLLRGPLEGLAPAALPLPAVLLLVAGALGVIGMLTLGLTAVAGALAISRSEAGPTGRLLSALGGIALLATPWATTALAGTGSIAGGAAALIGGTLAMHLGLTFLVFLGASVPYQLFPPHREATGIIILGSTLRDGRVTPLLRRRLGRAVAERERLLALGIDPLLVPSGGKGDAATPAESVAMAIHLRSTGVPEARVLAETAARTTEENLVLSHLALDAAGHRAPYLVATSGYHAFRAALLARGLGFGDGVVGGPTALSHLPTATLREYVLTLSYRWPWAVASLPLTLGLVALLPRVG